MNEITGRTIASVVSVPIVLWSPSRYRLIGVILFIICQQRTVFSFREHAVLVVRSIQGRQLRSTVGGLYRRLVLSLLLLLLSIKVHDVFTVPLDRCR